MKTGQSQRRVLFQAFWLNFVWMNVSEMLRYFLVVKPLVRADFAMVPGIVPDTPLVGALWVLWDVLLIAVTTAWCWLAIDRFGLERRVAVAVGTLVWATIFVLLWLGVHNMGLATPRILAAALPLAWVELVVSALLVRRVMMRDYREA